MRRLEAGLVKEVLDKIRLLKNKTSHHTLRIHKLHGPLSNYHSFSVNYQIRIIFKFEPGKEIVLFNIGNHDIYKK